MLCKKEKIITCNFCEKIKDSKTKFIQNKDANICSDCVISTYRILFGEIYPSDDLVDKTNLDTDIFAAIRKKKKEIKETTLCDYCISGESSRGDLIKGEDGYICSYCVVDAYKVLFGDVCPSEASI